VNAVALYIAVVLSWNNPDKWWIIEGDTMASCQELEASRRKLIGSEKEECKPVGPYEAITPADLKIMKGLAMFRKEAMLSTPITTVAYAGEGENDFRARQLRCLATAIYFEARGESTKGQQAVAQVVLTRVRSTLYPDTICGVVYQGQLRKSGCQFSFTCDGIADVPKDKKLWHKAKDIARKAMAGKTWLKDIGRATHFHANYVWPPWRKELKRVKQVGLHIFYVVRGDQLRDVLEG